jgi:DNA polymerase III delta prime subunit
MKYQSTKFEDYIQNCKKFNLHKEIIPLLTDINNDIKNTNNLILYGPSGIGKYTQALNYIKNFSPTSLRFERKMYFNFDNKSDFIFKISDIHFEIDMSLLGCKAKIVFNDLYYHILDVLSSRPKGSGIILCKNFHMIHSELLEIFYSYMQTLKHKNLNLVYIILTESVSFIPNNILNRCMIVPIKRPTKSNYIKITNKSQFNNQELSSIKNIKNLKSKIYNLNNLDQKIVGSIFNYIINYKTIKFIELRDKLYEIFIYNLDVHCFTFNIIKKLIITGHLKEQHIDKVFTKLHNFLKLYNNNYRPIYHLERFIFYLCIEIHGLQ